MYLYIILYMEKNKAQNTIQEKGIEGILFFYKLVEIQLKFDCIKHFGK